VNQKDAWNTVVEAAKAGAEAILEALNNWANGVLGAFNEGGGLPKPGTTASLMFQIELFVMLGSWATPFLIIAL